jgi:hypothetical protein
VTTADPITSATLAPIRCRGSAGRDRGSPTGGLVAARFVAGRLVTVGFVAGRLVTARFAAGGLVAGCAGEFRGAFGG